MNPRPLRILPILVLCALTLAPLALASDPEPLRERLETAWTDLGTLEDLLDDDDAPNRDVISYMDIVLKAAMELRPPPEPADDATSDVQRAHRAFVKSLAKYEDETIDLLLEALDESDLDRQGSNKRESVNEHAGPLLAKTKAFVTDEADRRRLSRRIIRKIKRLERARHTVGGKVFEGAFRALASLNDVRSLEWLMENYVHTRKQPEEVARLKAAMIALREFTSVPAATRYELADLMRKRYVAVESLARQSSTDVVALASKRFWDQIRTEVIPLMQHVTGYPRDGSGAALATMAAFAQWLRENEDPRRPPWTVPPMEPG